MLLAIFVVLFTFAIYFLGISHSVFGGDSGDIILASYFGGVAHPPGYPLNTMIGYIFTHLPFSATVAYKANLMSTVLMSFIIGLVFLIVKTLTKNTVIALAASLTLAFTPLIWLYGHIAEVFQLNLVLVSLSLLFLIRWRHQSHKRSPRFLSLSFIFWGLAVFHHQTSILLAPAYIYFIFKTDKQFFANFKSILKLGGALAIGFIPFLFIPIVASFDPPINWNQPTNLENFVRLITRADYGTFLASKSFVGSQASERLLQILSYFNFVRVDFSPVGVFLIIAGAVYLFFKDKFLFWFLTVAIFFSGPFFVSYASFALASDFLLGVWERFLMLSYLFLAIFLAFGALSLYEFWHKFNFRSHLRILLPTFLLSFLLLPFSLLLVNWSKTDLSSYVLGDFLGHDVLASSEPGALIFLFDDTVVFNTQYIYFTNDQFADRKIIIGGSLRHRPYRAQLMRNYPDLSIPSDFLTKSAQSADLMTDLIIKNSQKPIFTYGFAPKIENKAWLPSGILFKLVNVRDLEDPEILKRLETAAFGDFLISSESFVGYTHFAPAHIKSIYHDAYITAGNAFLEKGYFDQSLLYFWQAKNIVNSAGANIGLGKTYLKKSDCRLGKRSFDAAYGIDSQNIFVLERLSEIARLCDNDENLALKYERERDFLKSRREQRLK